MRFGAPAAERPALRTDDGSTYDLLRPGDVMELEIDGLGRQRQTLV